MWPSIKDVGYWQGEIWNRRRNGEIFPQLLTISTVTDNKGNPQSYVGVMTDISRIKQSEANLERLAHYDPLTRLPNRLLIQSRLEHALREGGKVAVLFIDLDHFKKVSDSLGHSAGDQVLVAVTERWSRRLRETDTFGRLGGDEFLIILGHANRPENAGSVAAELTAMLNASISLPQLNDIYIGSSIDIAIYPEDGATAEVLIQHADSAMHEAKERGRNNCRFYTPRLTEIANQRIEMVSRLHRAMALGQFELHYQPQIRISDGKIIGCEALVRWKDPDKGLVSPAQFIPVAEESGLIHWIMETAMAQLRDRIDRGLPDISMSVNLSGRQFVHQDDSDSWLRDKVEEFRLPLGRLKLELAGSVLMNKGEDAVNFLLSIKGTGVRLSIDDFGTGYSSLAYLKRFPIDELKIDRSFVIDIPDGKDDAEIAATIIAMAHKLRLNVVAEGVENEQQARILAEQGCDHYQGYLFSPAVPASDLERMIEAQR